ncbi:MAG: phosphoglycolate phosphatase [Gammaproteobacteria bacterium]|nr:phosphoglycolate phosphatase [Gammaproteobacteria bacterium]MCW8922823.1 phosphoglycolate phosphatase [Gammaproteobacteria bacterium]
MAIKKPAMVLIDVDGTLVDSVPDLAYCVDEMMKQLDMPVHGEARVRNWVGNGVERLTRRALIGQLDGEPDDALFEKAYPIFLDLYDKNVCERSCLYDGVREAIDFLKTQDVHIGCVTNKNAQFTLPILEKLGVKDDFEIIICGDTLDRKKPDPLPLLHAAEKMGVTAEQSLMLGDSMSDVKAARAAGFNIVCMSYGYNHGEDISDYNPDAVVDSMEEIKNIIDW